MDSSFVEQVEEYTCLNTDSSEIVVSNLNDNTSLGRFGQLSLQTCLTSNK
jgi:hypothetical protein